MTIESNFSLAIGDRVSCSRAAFAGYIVKITAYDGRLKYDVLADGATKPSCYHARDELWLHDRATLDVIRELSERLDSTGFATLCGLPYVSFAFGDSVTVNDAEPMFANETFYITGVHFESGRLWYYLDGDTTDAFYDSQLKLAARATEETVAEAFRFVCGQPDDEPKQVTHEPAGDSEDSTSVKAWPVSFNYVKPSGRNSNLLDHKELSTILYGRSREQIMDQINQFAAEVSGLSRPAENIFIGSPISLDADISLGKPLQL